MSETDSDSSSLIQNKSDHHSFVSFDSDKLTDRTPSSTGETTSSANILKKELARRETKFIFKLRVLVICLLIILAIGVSTLVFIITEDAEKSEFETQFQGASHQILDAFYSIKTDRIAVLSSLAVAAIAHGVDHSRSWPFVALSSFQQRSLTARSHSGILQVSINPLVNDENRDEWERYVVEETDSQWIHDTWEYQEKTGVSEFLLDYNEKINAGVEYQHIAYYDPHDEDHNERHASPSSSGPYLPYWEMSPLLSNRDINIDMIADTMHRNFAMLCQETGSVVLGDLQTSVPGNVSGSLQNFQTRYYTQLLSIAAQEKTEYRGDPMTYVYIPIFDSFEQNRVPKAVMTGIFNWASFFEEVVPPSTLGIDIVLENNCSGSYTYRINGNNVIPLGHGDLHEKEFSDMVVASGRLEKGTIADGTKSALKFHEGECFYAVRIYPSSIFHQSYHSSTPIVITFTVAIIFALAIAMFLVYDQLVERRQKLVLKKAVQSNAIVSSLFPKNVRDRLMESNLADDRDRSNHFHHEKEFQTPKLKNFLGQTTRIIKNDALGSNQLIADLFPNCTVLFADIVGFTAWSSTRDPSQVFALLQSVYQSFDQVASKRRVFKVETIGDCYVAVTGLPEPQENHAVIMAKFATECRAKLGTITQKLEVVLGPDTGDLTMRFGLHSGQVTAGVLQGDRARFQLFGDTVNMASRMESTSVPNKIQISTSTADCLRAGRKEHWFRPREEPVHAKGIGHVDTFWLDIRSKSGSSNDESPNEGLNEPIIWCHHHDKAKTKNCRLVDWMAELISEYMKRVVAKRNLSMHQETHGVSSGEDLLYHSTEGQTCLDEVVEALTLPKYDGKGLYGSDVVLPLDAVVELREFVSKIAEGYKENPFHNFDHACHVTMSVHKLLKRVTKPNISEEDLAKGRLDDSHLALRLHDYTHGINSDPLTTMAIMFSALVHDVDHRGVSNAQMCKEEPEMAEYYKQKSIAEQNSLDVAWDMLMSTRYEKLRACMFGNKVEMMRFRQVLVNVVLATDIFDKELNDMRKERWRKAFGPDPHKIDNNLQATIVLEHIIQASDVSHTMQHWHVYLKWNQRLFREMTSAYQAGRMGTDPAEFWYEGELNFFDNYIIPLAKKLKECQVFGVSSDEYLNYAKSNRTEWKEKGASIVELMKQEINRGCE